MALFEHNGDTRHLDFINELYRHHPPLPDNSVTKAMKKIYANTEELSGIIKSVLRYMGLIEIYNQLKGKAGEGDT